MSLPYNLNERGFSEVDYDVQEAESSCMHCNAKIRMYEVHKEHKDESALYCPQCMKRQINQEERKGSVYKL